MFALALGITLSPALIFSFGDSLSHSIDATVESTSQAQGYDFSPYEAVITDKGRFALKAEFNGQILPGQRYRMTVDNSASSMMLKGVSGIIEKFELMP